MREFQNAFEPFGLNNTALQSSYAMAENVFAVTQSDISQPFATRNIWVDGQEFRRKQAIVPLGEGTAGSVCFASSGRLLHNHEARILSDSGQHLEEGHVGEIAIRSDSLFEGYYSRPDLTVAALVDGWYHTGDLEFYLNGELFVVGRKKDLLIVGGENFYPQDIEEIVGGHPAIHNGRVVAMGMYNPALGTDDIFVVAEVGRAEDLANAETIERELRNCVVAGIGVAVRVFILKPPRWIVKSTAGKAARSATRDKLLREHPGFDLKV